MTGKKLTGRRRDSINVCYLIDVAPDFYTGGGQVHLTNLIREFKRSNLAVAKLDLNYLVFGGQSPNTLVRCLWCFWVTGQVIFFHFFRRRFDLIHAHSVPAMAAGRLLSLILGIPIVVTVHGSNLINLSKFKVQSSKFKVNGIKLFIEKLILTGIKYDAQITVSRDFLKVPNVNINVIYVPNGVDISRFRRDKFRIQNSEFRIILFVGRKNDLAKGFKILEEAFELVKQEIPNIRLLVADGSVPRDEVIKMYGEADLFVLPSLSEGFPLTLLEAWAAKLPVVATAVGEVSYLIKEGVNGYLVQPGNSEILAKSIISALKNKHLAKLGENGYNLAREYTWERTARETLGVYQKIC